MFLVPLIVALTGLSAAADPKPNIVVLLSDDLGYGDLGCFGHPRIKTPHLDQLARDGLRLTACYAGAPVCSPSRAALFTGRNPNRLGIRDWIPLDSGIHLPRDEITVAKLLKDAGYTTCLAGKWHLNSRFNGKGPVCSTDLLPTLCAAAGTEPPKERTLDGTNVLPLLEGKPVARAQLLYWQYDKVEGGAWTVAVRQGPWKLLATLKLEYFALYNVVEDVAEKHDRAAEQPEQVKNLRATLERLYREVNP